MNSQIKVLVVEDDELVQTTIEDSLSEGGFETAATASGEEAIGLLRENTAQYRVLVTDINILGRLDGWELARAAREMDPSLPVIYMTGTNGGEWASKGVPNSVLLKKPFAPAQIVTAVAALLNASPPIEAPEKGCPRSSSQASLGCIHYDQPDGAPPPRGRRRDRRNSSGGGSWQSA